MSRPTVEDQCRFLLSCVKHSNNGKVDFVSVSRDCAITSRGAAAKRYGRLLRMHGVQSKGEHATKAEQEAVNKRKSKASIARAAEAKLRKIEGNHNDPLADDGDVGRPIKKEPGIKQERSPFSLMSTPRSMSAAGQHPQDYGHPSGPAGYGMSTEATTLYIKIEEGFEKTSKSLTEAASSAGYDADDERIFEAFCTSELFSAGQSLSATSEDVSTSDGVPASPVKEHLGSLPKGGSVPHQSPASRGSLRRRNADSSLQEANASAFKNGDDQAGSGTASAAARVAHTPWGADVIVILD